MSVVRAVIITRAFFSLASFFFFLPSNPTGFILILQSKIGYHHTMEVCRLVTYSY